MFEYNFIPVNIMMGDHFIKSSIGTRQVFGIFVIVLLICLIAGRAYAVNDYPHNDATATSCSSCHNILDETNIVDVTSHSFGLDDSIYNNLCWGCHNDVEAADVETHSYLQIGRRYGEWSVECVTCHNPHTQNQVLEYITDTYLATGISDIPNGIQLNNPQVGQSTLTDSTKIWTINEFQNLLVIPDTSYREYGYKILSNTTDTLTVDGMFNDVIASGDTYAVVYGKLVKETIYTDDILVNDPPTSPKGIGDKTVRFFNSTGANSFADGDTTYDGICEVCHTQTTHFRNDGDGDDPLHSNMGYPAGMNCTECHQHINGFKGADCTVCHATRPATGSHPAHLSVGALCEFCHDGAVEGSMPPEQHLDNNIDVYDSSSGDLGYPEHKLKGSAYATCLTAICHDDGTGNPAETPVWGTEVTDCSECHATRPATGSHPAHLSFGASCEFCHDGAVEGSTPPEQHLDNNIDVYDASSGDLGYPEDKIKGSAYSTCLTAYCHSNGQGVYKTTPEWGMSVGACNICHDVTEGTLTTGSHPTHFNDSNGPDNPDTAVTCDTCHGANATLGSHTGHINGVKNFVEGALISLANTTICDSCHSADGAQTAKTYWAQNPSSWVAAEGEEGYCGSCHDGTPGNSDKDGNGDDAPNIVGNKSSYGFYVKGHGKTSGNYAPLSWQDVLAAGNPAANKQCDDCHDLTSSHFYSMTKRLKAGYENDNDNSNCKQCHDPGTVAVGDPEWYTTYGDYQNSAHSSEKCSNCHDVHGVSGPYPGMTKDNQESLCYQCHTEGGVQNFGVSGYTGTHDGGDNQNKLTDSTANFPTLNVYLYSGWRVYNLTDGSSGTITSSGYDANNIPATLSGGAENDWDNGDEYHIAYVDDIQQAFGMSEKHNLGTSFTRGSGNYTLECISCHNVHLVTGKHWDAEQGLSPVTRVTNNTTVWGDEPGEKMEDFAAQGAGSGGFYYKTAQGYGLGATGLPMDAGGAYRPPKKGSGYDLEFSGDVLPDYTSLCLDCHSYRMSDANPPVNWGQGIGCTDNSIDPPDQRIECGAAHGLGVAGKPSYVSDSGTAGFWGTSGNPDVLFNMNYVTRGRHNGHFMRWPYDSADRGAGINFVLSCTDCHEAHGASGPSMLRPAVNNYTPGTSIWNTFCNACHYYYGGQHEGMSCANASCHEAVSIHRIIHVVDSGADTQLMLTSSGYESSFVKPDFTPEMISIEGHINSTDLTVTFDNGVWSNVDLSGSIDKDDFWLFDKDGNNPRTIESVTHVSGSSTATLTMSAPLTETDLSADTMAIKPASIWNWYDGGYYNADSGAIVAQAVSGGPWPVTITGPPPFNVQSVLYGGTQLQLNGIINDSNQIYVTFAEGAYSIIASDLQVGDFVLNCGGRTILSVTHSAGDSFAILTLNTIVNQSEVGVCTVAAAPDSIFDSYGNPAGTTAVTLALPPEASVDDLILRWDFNEGTGTVANSNGALGTQEDMHGVLTRNVQWAASTKPSSAAGDNVVKMDRVSDRGAVQLNYTINPDDGFPPATYNSGGAPVIIPELERTSEFSFSVWIKPTALGCDEGKTLGLNNKLRRDVMTTQFWIKNWALGIMRFSDDGDPLNGNCIAEDSTHDVLRFWVAVGDPNDMRCDAWGGSWPEYVHPVSPAGYIQGSTLMPTDQAICDTSATPILPTNTQAHSFAQTETTASGAPTYGGVALQPGVWQHVVGTWDGRYIRIYIDTQLAAETDMGGTGSYVMVADPHLWGGDLVGDGSLFRHVSSGFGIGARPIFSGSGSPSGGAVYWNTNGYYDLNNSTYVGELDDVKYWNIALPLSTIQY